MSWVSVHANSYGTSDTTGITISVLADGSSIADYVLYYNSNYKVKITNPGATRTVDLQEPIIRLPASYGEEFEVQVSGSHTINEVCLAQELAEIIGT